jgi:two-component system sensor histidine kinase CiaH
MSEQERFKEQLIKHMIYNIIAFSIIFLMFGFIACFMIRNITFSSVDLELKKSAEIYTENQSNFNNFNNFSKNWFMENSDMENSMNDIKDYMLARKISNPNAIVILRDNENNVLNENDLGRNYNQYLTNISFNQSILDKIYTIRINNEYNYRAINIKLDADEDKDVRYVQILINVDSEIELISHYFDIISIVIVFGIITSIIASYILSKKTLIPIAETLEKQTEFVQNASHELRTPLTIIQAKQELLLQEPNAKIIDKSEDIVLTLNETKRMTKLTKDLMMLARADDKRLTINKEKVDVDNFIEDLSKPYIEIAELDDKKLDLNLGYNEEVSLDTNKIYQVLVILLDNAIKYTEPGDSIEIATKSESGKCIIEVKDTGIGISEESIKHIFDRFYREDKARNRETGGSGLGLSIADVIVKAHSGTIKASHNEPKGTIFTIRLPK